MSNAWDIPVTTCADCPLHVNRRCEASRFMTYLDATDSLDLSASLDAKSPPPAGCPLENGDMRIEIALSRKATRCRHCGQLSDVCPFEIAWLAWCRGEISEAEREAARALCQTKEDQR
jgi:ferredoxin